MGPSWFFWEEGVFHPWLQGSPPSSPALLCPGPQFPGWDLEETAIIEKHLYAFQLPVSGSRHESQMPGTTSTFPVPVPFPSSLQPVQLLQRAGAQIPVGFELCSGSAYPKERCQKVHVWGIGRSGDAREGETIKYRMTRVGRNLKNHPIGRDATQ